MNYFETLQTQAEQRGNIACVGFDPVLEQFPASLYTPHTKKIDTEKTITTFFNSLLNGFESENILPATIKPNIAYYEQYGFEGLRALQEIIATCKKLNVSVLLDAKRGDIGKTSKGYAKAVFAFWKVAEVT